jgi:hypothetical protein
MLQRIYQRADELTALPVRSPSIKQAYTTGLTSPPLSKEQQSSLSFTPVLPATSFLQAGRPHAKPVPSFGLSNCPPASCSLEARLLHGFKARRTAMVTACYLFTLNCASRRKVPTRKLKEVPHPSGGSTCLKTVCARVSLSIAILLVVR